MGNSLLHHCAGVCAYPPRRKPVVAALLVSSIFVPSRCLAQNENNGFTVGFEQRVRNEQWHNILDFSDRMADDQNQIRWRTRLWTRVPLTGSIDVFAGLNQETNQVISPRRPWRMDEVILENAYVDFRRLFSAKWSLRIGRQNLALGEGFLVLDGGPWDGSRSTYFNAATLSYTTSKSKLQWIVIADPGTESYLPHIHDRDRRLVEWDEHAVGAYFTAKPLANTVLDLYGFWKREFHDGRPVASIQYQPDKRVNTAGARASHRIGNSCTVVGEFALQRGRQSPGTDVAARAGYGYLRRTFARFRQGYLQGGYWLFSGDDPRTAAVEDWDPLFARWPKWSELYIYSQFNERGVGYWTNLGMWQAEAGVAPIKSAKLRGTYYYMTAFHPFARGDRRIFGPGTGRGHNWQVRADITVNRNWSGHVLYERHLPGDFYSRRTAGDFLRFEILFHWSKNWPLRPRPSALKN